MPRFNPYRQFIGVVVIPNCILKLAEISQGAKLAWARLAQYAGESGDAYPSLKTLGEELGIKEAQARRYVEELVKAGFLEREERSGYTPKYWHLDDHPCFNPTAEGSLIREGGGTVYGRGGVPYTVPEENQIRESSKSNNPQGGNGKPKTPYAEQGAFEHFLGAQLRLANLRHEKVSEKVRGFLGRLDEQAADREAFRAGLVEAIREHPGTGNTLSQDLGGYGGLAKDAPRRQSAKSTHRPVAEATRETRLGWIREFEEKEAAKRAQKR